MADTKLRTPVRGDDPTGTTVYELIRDDIITGRLSPNERLKVSDLATRHGVSTSPVREALQVLRGEGFVVISPNRGARVRPIDADFVRDIYEVETLIEPHLMAGFMDVVSEDSIAALRAVQARIEALDFADERLHSELDLEFHMITYAPHYNSHLLEIWRKHRNILGAISHRFPTALTRRRAVIAEHRELIEAIAAGDTEQACTIIGKHAEGSGKHTIKQMQVYGLDSAPSATFRVASR